MDTIARWTSEDQEDDGLDAVNSGCDMCGIVGGDENVT